MVTNSYPAVGTGGLTETQWSTMYGGDDGIVEDYMVGGIKSCELARFDSTDICRVGAGSVPSYVRVNGYTLEIPSAGEDLYCAPVVAPNPPVTYYIVAVYDPAMNVANGDGTRTLQGPVRLQILTTLPAGKAYVLLYTLVRSPSQTLSQTAKTDHRRWQGTTIETPLYSTITSGNPPAGVGPFPRGSVVYQSSIGEYSVRTINATGDALAWQSLTSTPSRPFPAPSALIAYDVASAPIYYSEGSRVFCAGALKRSSGASLSSGAGTDVILGTLPVGFRPGGVRRFICHGTGGMALGVRVFPDTGQVIMSGPATDTVFCDLSSINYRAEN